MSTNFRPLTPAERAIIEKLFEAEFPGRDELRLQLKSAVAKQLLQDGTLELRCLEGPAAPVKFRLAVEGYMTDSDGVPIFVMLFADRGYMSLLEIAKADGSQIIDMPTAATITVS